MRSGGKETHKEERSERVLLEDFRNFVHDKLILIADTSQWSLDYITKLLKTMGVMEENVIPASDFAFAEKAIMSKKPQVIISDYDINKKCGLDLIQIQRKHIGPSKISLFVLVTANTSQVTVARAAEEEVDAYILRPFSSSALRDAILRAAEMKTDPGKYLKMIDEGKEHLAAKKLDEATVTLEAAKALDRAPALACYYLGQVEMARKEFTKAEMRYIEGIQVNKIHYKCMMGLYEALMEQKKFGDAYTVVKRISRYFPANPQRLATVLKLAVLTQGYEDVERYYQIFTKLDKRDPELIKYLCAALVVCGKYYLKKNIKTRALDLFRKAVIAADKNTKINREVILSLMEFNLVKDIDKFFALFPAETKGTLDYVAISYLLADRHTSTSIMIAKGQDLINKGHQDPLIYQILIRRMMDNGQETAAHPLIQTATQKWPDLKGNFMDSGSAAGIANSPASPSTTDPVKA